MHNAVRTRVKGLLPTQDRLCISLYKHQLRELLENETTTDGDLAGDFGQRWDCKSRGGCLADQVGTGKTAK